MSVVQELGATLTKVSENLPVDEVRLASDRVQAAAGLFGYVLHTTSRSIGLSQLASATTSLEQAYATLIRAKEALAEYTLAIGLGAQPTTRAPAASAVEEQPVVLPQPRQSKQAPALDDWWESRVDAITLLDDPVEKKADEKPLPAAELLRRVATLVRKEQPKPLRAELAKAGPAIGLRLTALCTPLLKELSTELLRRDPSPDDVPELRKRLDKLTVKTLPGLPEQLPDILLGRACRAEPTHGAHGVPEHPVDSAVGGAVLVGALLTELRRQPESLVLPEDGES